MSPIAGVGSCSGFMFLMVTAVLAFQLEKDTTDRSKLYNNKTARTFIDVMIAFGVVGMLLAMFMVYKGV